MKTVIRIASVAVVAVLATLTLRADVKTKERTQIKFGGGFMGSLMNRMAGDAAKDGVVATVAVKGNRMSRMLDTTGQIIDLSEEKIYDIDVKKKEYKITTFEEMRKRLQQAKQDAEKQAKSMPQEDKDALEEGGKQIEFDVDIKETGQTKQIAGYNAKEVVMTITAREKGKKLEDSGGFVMKNDMWLAPRLAALDEVGAFQMKYFKALYGESIGLDPQQMASLMAMFPSMAQMSQKMQAEGAKLQGTPLLTTTTFETVKSADQMKAASSGQSSGGGGGIGGALANRLMRRGPVEPRSTMMTTTVERLSVETSASADDVAIPAGFKEKK